MQLIIRGKKRWAMVGLRPLHCQTELLQGEIWNEGHIWTTIRLHFWHYFPVSVHNNKLQHTKTDLTRISHWWSIEIHMHPGQYAYNCRRCSTKTMTKSMTFGPQIQTVYSILNEVRSRALVVCQLFSIVNQTVFFELLAFYFCIHFHKSWKLTKLDCPSASRICQSFWRP